MLSLTFADELLVVVAAALLIAEIYALRMVRRTRQMLDGGAGDYLLRVVFRFGVVVTAAQAFTLVNACLRYIDFSMDARLAIFLAIESMLAVAFLWTVWEIHNLPADRYAYHATRERSDPPVCVCEEIDDPVSLASAPVNQGDIETPVAPI